MPLEWLKESSAVSKLDHLDSQLRIDSPLVAPLANSQERVAIGSSFAEAEDRLDIERAQLGFEQLHLQHPLQWLLTLHHRGSSPRDRLNSVFHRWELSSTVPIVFEHLHFRDQLTTSS